MLLVYILEIMNSLTPLHSRHCSFVTAGEPVESVCAAFATSTLPTHEKRAAQLDSKSKPFPIHVA